MITRPETLSLTPLNDAIFARLLNCGIVTPLELEAARPPAKPALRAKPVTQGKSMRVVIHDIRKAIEPHGLKIVTHHTRAPGGRGRIAAGFELVKAEAPT
jgi:hypothetical protein